MSKFRISAVVLAAVLFAACGGAEPVTGKHSVLGEFEEAFVDAAGKVESGVPAALEKQVAAFATASAANGSSEAVTVDYPLDGSIFPPEFLAPTFLWHDTAAKADTWLVTIEFQDRADGKIQVLVPGSPPPKGEIDLQAISETNELYEGTEYQRSARAWTPTAGLWEEIKRRSAERPATVTFTGFAATAPTTPLSHGATTITTSKDPVGAPFFYRDVPMMSAVGQHGRIQPLGEKAIPLIAWRLRDVSRPQPKLVLKGMPACGNCHSFSADGKTLGMDVDGPDGDKGMYAIKSVEENLVIDYEDVITWNSFPNKPEGHRTIGFMSRVSPDGRYVASTVNEALFVRNFKNHKFLQVFYPTRGIIGFYSREDEEFHSLKGADDPEYVHCSPVWTPDGKWIIFSRAKAFDPYTPGMTMPTEPNDPNEPQIRYNLYRVPFNDGKGGKPEPIAGASHNDFSNTFPKVSPDGKWLVWTRCKNGLLMRPDSLLFIVPVEGGEPREMKCNTPLMNSWHSFAPNSRWLVFSSKSRTPYTQAFLTHIDENGDDSPAILVPNCTAANRAVNLPEFLNAPYDALDTIKVPVVDHHTHTIQAERKMNSGDFEGARVEFQKALEREPTFGRALVNLGAALMELGQYEDALIHLEEASRVHPRDLHALYNRGLSYLETGRAHMAKRCLDKLIEIAPNFPGARAELARAERAIGNLTDELTAAKQALEQDPGSVRIHRDLADMCRRTGRLEESVAYFEKACELANRAAPVIATLGWMLATNPDETIRDGKRAVKLAQEAVEKTGAKRPEPFDILAAAYAETGDFEKAVEAVDNAIALAKQTAPDMVPTLEDRKAKYENKKPLRTAMDR